MRLAVSVSKAAEHRVGERSPENFLNSIEEVRDYTLANEAKYFVNIRGHKAEKGIKPLDFKSAYVQAQNLIAEGYSDRDVFISAIIEKVATADDIDF